MLEIAKIGEDSGHSCPAAPLYNDGMPSWVMIEASRCPRPRYAEPDGAKKRVRKVSRGKQVITAVRPSENEKKKVSPSTCKISSM